jgi:hypothetical protein
MLSSSGRAPVEHVARVADFATARLTCATAQRPDRSHLVESGTVCHFPKLQWYAAMVDEEQSIGKKVRLVIGQNIKRIRDDVEGMKGSDLSDRLNELGLKLSTSGVSEVETPKRKLGADELLIIAIALNTRIIDLLTPKDGSPLTVAEGVEPLPPSWLEGWLRGETPWPATSDKAVQNGYFKTASKAQTLRHRTETRTDLQESLRVAVCGDRRHRRPKRLQPGRRRQSHGGVPAGSG